MTPISDARAAEALERALAPAGAPENPFGWRCALALDEREAFPEELVAALTSQGLLRRFVPRSDGGELESFSEAALLMRVASRRDLTSAIAVGQAFLGSVPVWLKGSPAQRARQAQALTQGKLAALALTEEAHGSDLLAGDVRATGGRLAGTKWLINNATRCALATVLARTNDGPGLNAFSLFQVDKAAAEAGEVRCLPKIATHGIRGADISGLVLDVKLGPAAAMLGAEGSGLDATLKALQVTRLGCAAFSLGAGDTALRLALEFALERRLYGATVFDIPHARAVLTTAFLDLLIAEALALGAWRGLHQVPEQMSLASAVVKYFVPTRVEALIRDVAVVLGARHHLREGYFQKLMRDAAVVSLFDGSTAVNQEGIALQLSRLTRAPDSGVNDRLRARFDLTAPLPGLRFEALELMGPGFDDVLQGCEPLKGELAALPAIDRRARRSPKSFESAERAAALYAAASCLHLNAPWAQLAVQRLTTGALVESPELTEQMLELHRQPAWFSTLGVAL